MCRLDVKLASPSHGNNVRAKIESGPRLGRATTWASVRSDDAVKGRNRQKVGKTRDFDHRSKAEIGSNDGRRGGSDHRKAAVHAPRPDEHVLFAETSERRHRD